MCFYSTCRSETERSIMMIGIITWWVIIMVVFLVVVLVLGTTCLENRDDEASTTTSSAVITNTTDIATAATDDAIVSVPSSDTSSRPTMIKNKNKNGFINNNDSRRGKHDYYDLVSPREWARSTSFIDNPVNFFFDDSTTTLTDNPLDVLFANSSESKELGTSNSGGGNAKKKKKKLHVKWKPDGPIKRRFDITTAENSPELKKWRPDGPMPTTRKRVHETTAAESLPRKAAKTSNKFSGEAKPARPIQRRVLPTSSSGAPPLSGVPPSTKPARPTKRRVLPPSASGVPPPSGMPPTPKGGKRKAEG